LVSQAELRDIEEEIALKFVMPTSRNPTGHAVYVDDFETRTTIYPWVQVNGTVAIDNTRRIRGVQCLSLSSPDTQWSYGTARLSLGRLADNKFGLELWWMTNELEGNWIFKIGPIMWRDGTNRYGIGVYYDNAAAEHKWYYLSALEDSWTAITGGSQVLESGDYRSDVWHYVKVTWDKSLNKYGKLWSDNLEAVDMSSLNLPSTSDTTFPRIEIPLQVQNRVATATRELYIDDFNFTEDEPQ